MQEGFAGTWVPEPHMSASTLGSLYALNHRFLDLCASHTDGWPAAQRIRLPGEMPARVAPLSTAQRAAAAHCPYALFDLKFGDEEHWRQRFAAAAAGEWRVSDAAPAGGDAAEFVRLAIFFAWHLASSAAGSARLILGMHGQTAGAFRAAAITSLPSLAAGEIRNLSARWCTSDAYWSALTRAAALPSAEKLRKAQLFGLQLAAADRLA